MNDRVKITGGLALFVILVTFPVWRAFGSPAPAPPDLTKAASGTQCVADPEWMNANHQQLLDQWRDAVVREGKAEFTSANGTRHEMDLSRTCLGCHGSAQAFCEQCHNYANVQLSCWSCHLDPSREAMEP